MTEHPTPTQPAPPRQARGVWPMRDRPGVLWLVLAGGVALGHQWVPDAAWLMTHLVLLGALTHSVMVWSSHFATTVLKTPPTIDDRAQQTRRLVLLLLGTTMVLVGVPMGWWLLTLAGASVVSAAVVWHGVQLWRRLRFALPGRFRVTVRYYVAAAVCMPVGAGFGATLARGPSQEWHERLIVAHISVMALGWLGLTVAGTLLTLWPTMLRTRMDDSAELRARQALPIYLSALALVVAGALTGLHLVVVAGMVVYLWAMGWWGRSLLGPLRRKTPSEFAPLSVAAGLLWLAGGLLAATVTIARGGLDDLNGLHGTVASIVAVGFGLQLLTGALTYLVPSVLGGGPAVVRAGQAWLERWALLRLVVINGGLLLCLLPVPSWVRVIVSVLVLVALAAFVPLLLGGIRAAVAARRQRAGGEVPDSPPTPRVWSTGQLVTGLTALAVAVAVGVGFDASPSASLTGSAEATGETTRVRVVAEDMTFSPASITVPAGNELVVELVNEDDEDSHDIVFANGRRSPRLAPGESAVVEVGVVGVGTEAWCSVVGHRRMGMVMQVVVEGGVVSTSSTDGGASTDGDVSTDGDASTDEGGGHDHAAHEEESVWPEASTGSADGQDGSADGQDGSADGQDGSADGHSHEHGTTEFTPYDASLGPVPRARVHRITLTVREVEQEVAPGVWQRRWTYNGQSPAPTLHGKVGDRFVVTVVNEGEMTHSIDFHAGERAPDQVMVGIPAGESLTYRFTAKRAGMWMYHCSTMPMSSHIAAGMAGAVVIEPADLAPVDRSYLVVQSEVFLAENTTEGSADMVDDAAVAEEQPDLVVFNGRANQYDTHPLAARVGERVRIWVLDVGPNRSSSFHVVGDQFDTVYSEGAYLLKRGRDAFGNDDGGAQVLSLNAAQGGFVELEFDEPGSYPFVSHVMVDAERGAHGIFDVRP